MNCKTCGKTFHHCSSCGSDHPRDIGWCSDKCWEKSDTYCDAHRRFKKLIDSMDFTQLSGLNWLLEEVNFDDYYSIFQAMILSRFTNETD